MIVWKKLKMEAPFFLFIPQDKNKKAEYDKGISVKDMFRISGVGITTAHDDFVIDLNKEKLLQKFKDFKNSYPSADELHKKFNVPKKVGWDILKGWKNIQDKKDLNKYIQKISYRPFDTRYIFYEEKLVWRCVKDIFEHFVQDEITRGFNPLHTNRNETQGAKATLLSENSNIALNVARQSKVSGSWQYCFITKGLVDLSFMDGGNTGAGYIFPLYIYDTANVRKILREENEEIGGMFEDIKHFENTERIENFMLKFRKFINEKYGNVSAEEILGYIYAVLFHKEYRKKYLDFLNIDFPKIPFVDKKEYFLKLSKLGERLYNLHLSNEKINLENVGEPMFKDAKNKNEKIEKINYNENDKDLFVNKSLYFKNVSKEVWEYKIGGYKVLDKYLKSHKNENIDYSHFENVIKILTKSLEIENEISKLDFIGL